MLLWDLEFPQSPEDRVGMLFWRMHRTARIIFSLSFHLGTMTPQECIDFLVERVGHERANAEGEVRRSFNGSYSPLYQVAYMIGGLQFRALHRELVGVEEDDQPRVPRHDPEARGDAGRDGPRVAGEGAAARDYKARWKFYEAPRVQTRIDREAVAQPIGFTHFIDSGAKPRSSYRRSAARFSTKTFNVSSR